MMIIINRVGDYITGSVNGQPFGVSFDEGKHNAMLALQNKANEAQTMQELQAIVEEFLPLTQESFKELVETQSPYIHVNKSTNKFYLKYGEKVSSQPLPQIFVDRILKSVEKGIDVTPLIKCWARYMRPVTGRPKYDQNAAALFAKYIDADYTHHDVATQLQQDKGVSADVAKAMATTKQVAITQEGLLVCYKVSEEILHRYELNEEEEVVQKSRYGKSVDPDTGLVTYNKPEFVEERLFRPYVMKDRGDEFFCGSQPGHFIRVGEVHFLDSWDKVGMPGCKGLHVGGLRYIAGYQQEGTVTHNVFVDPMHIYGIAGLGCGNDGAMTVKQYFVHSSFAGVNKNIYHSSKYAALTDAEYAKIVEEAVEATQAKQAELAGILDEARSLTTITATSVGGVEAQSTGSVFGS